MKRPNPFAKGSPKTGAADGKMAPPFAKKAKGKKGKKKGFVPFGKKG